MENFPNITRRAICGNWQQEYSRIHRDALVGLIEQKINKVNSIMHLNLSRFKSSQTICNSSGCGVWLR